MLSWGNLDAALEDDLTELTLLRNDVFLDYYTTAFYSAVSVMLLIVGFNILFTSVGPKVVREMSEVARLIFINHCLFLLIFLGTCVPYSIALIRILFSSDPIGYFAAPSTFYMIAFSLSLQLTMYGYEGALRSVIRVNKFLVVHHVAFCAFVILALQSRSVFVGKAGLILSCFATYEWPPFVALVARRMRAPKAFVTYTMAVSMAFVVLTRLVQAALLIGLFVAGYGPQNETSKGIGLWWASLVLSALVVTLQCYLIVIYLRIVRRTKRPQAVSRGSCSPTLPRHSPANPAKPHEAMQQPATDVLDQITDLMMTTQSLELNGTSDIVDTHDISSMITDTVNTDIWASTADLLPVSGPDGRIKIWKPSSWRRQKA